MVHKLDSVGINCMGWAMADFNKNIDDWCRVRAYGWERIQTSQSERSVWKNPHSCSTTLGLKQSREINYILYSKGKCIIVIWRMPR